MAEWNFLTNHGLLVTYIGRHPDSTGLEIAQAVGITERAARKIVADLQAEGFIEREKVGRRNRYRINSHRPLRLLGDRGVTVGALLELLWRDEDRAVPGEQPASAPRLAGRTSEEVGSQVRRHQHGGARRGDTV